MAFQDPTFTDALMDLLRIISYDMFMWLCNAVIITYFRDIKTRGSFNIPTKGPIIFVIGPHHNQFVDAAVAMSKIKEFSGRRPSILIANKSYKLRGIGHAAKMSGAIPVERAQDIMQKGQGTIKSADGINIIGTGTKFTEQLSPKGLIGLGSLCFAQIDSIEDDTHVTLKKPLRSSNPKVHMKILGQLTNGAGFKFAPHIDNQVVFQNVYDHLSLGKSIGIFPEGGSHDRPDLLPLKPGVAIMALGSIASLLKEGHFEIEPVNIVPVGLNYFHPHKFRSRVVVEFGKPIVVDKSMGEQYQIDTRATANKLLEEVTLALKEVTVTCDDYDTLMALQATRRLYTSGSRSEIPTPLVIKMNRRLVKAYKNNADDTQVISMKKEIVDYNKKLLELGLHDHQVETLTETDRVKTFITLLERLFKVIVLGSLALPGAIMFSPIFYTARKISRKKAREALASSSVKIKAQDVVGTWKVLVALGLAPILYTFYSVIGTIYIIKKGYLSCIPFPITFGVFYAFSILITYSALRAGEVGVDLYKSLKPLGISVFSQVTNRIQIARLKAQRRKLAQEVTEFCQAAGSKIFEDYDKYYRDDHNDQYSPLSKVKSSDTLNDFESMGIIPIFADESRSMNSDNSETDAEEGAENIELINEKLDDDVQVRQRATTNP